jgi:tight adherence protein B
MTTLVIALCGSGASAWLARQARRYAVLDRMRVRTGRRLPSWLEPRLVRMLDDAAIEMPALQIVQMWGLLALVVAIVGIALDAHLALAGIVSVALGGPLVLHALRHRRSRAVTAAIPDALERVAAELRAGGTVASAIAWLGTDPGPLASDFARAQARVQLGAALPDALQAWAGERPAAGARSVAGALAVAHAQGGRAADALDSLATSLRERLGVVAEAHALSAQARYSALVVGIGPLVYLGFSMIVDRRAIDALIGTKVGRLCAVAALALEGAGAWWMRRVLASGPKP